MLVHSWRPAVDNNDSDGGGDDDNGRDDITTMTLNLSSKTAPEGNDWSKSLLPIIQLLPDPETVGSISQILFREYLWIFLDAIASPSGSVMFSDFGDSYRIYPACELVLSLSMPQKAVVSISQISENILTPNWHICVYIAENRQCVNICSENSFPFINYCHSTFTQWCF